MRHQAPRPSGDGIPGSRCGTCCPGCPGWRAIPRRLRPRMAPESLGMRGGIRRKRRADARAGSCAAAGSKEPAGPMAEGVIFTNLQALARKFGTDAAAVRKLLAAYAEASAAHGIRYRIVDAGDYVFLNPGPGATAPWRFHRPIRGSEHGYLLADYYRFGRSTADDETNYLFIVGGADVIPMPVLPQYISDPDYSDTDIDSDIPYAYLLGERTYPMLGTAEIFQYEQYFHTGRLPLAHDASLDDLAGYLRARPKPPVRWPWAGLTGRPTSRGFGLGFGQRAFPPQPTLPGRHAAR
ncbi:MAG: hypothetical protein ACLTZY_02920 [Alistipes indistinctus]